MKGRRPDLARLSDDALARLTNPGLVKRARRELERGAEIELEMERDGSLLARLDGVVVRLPASGFDDGTCTCGATASCRHRVMAVMALRDRAAVVAAPELTRASDEDIARALGAVRYRKARALFDAGLEARVLFEPELRVELPTASVRFLASYDLDYARCDCRRGRGCVHVALACWVSYAADGRGGPVVIAPAHPASSSDDHEAIEQARALARDVLARGTARSVQVSEALAPRFALTARSLDAAGLRWLLAATEALERSLRGGHAARTAARLSEIEARARAALSGSGELPRDVVLGRGEPEATRLGTARFVSLGARVRERVPPTGTSIEHSTLRIETFLADPSHGQILVHRHEARGVSPDGLESRPIAPGVTLGALARGQMVTRAATRRANRELRLAVRAIADASVTPQRGEWSELGEAICPPTIRALRHDLEDRPPTWLRPRVRAGDVRALPVVGIERARYSTADERLVAEAVDRDGDRITIVKRRGACERALHAALDAFESGPRYLSFEARREGGAWVLNPLSVVTDRVVVLDLERAEKGRLPRAAPSPERDPIATSLSAAREALDRTSHAGLSDLTAGATRELTESARELESLGLATCGAALAAIVTAEAPVRVERWLDASIRVGLALEIDAPDAAA